jgi:hypothetical protein
MKKIYYEKVGSRYIPVAEYDSTLLDALPKGSHLVNVVPGGVSYRFKVDPGYAAMIAAGIVAEDAIAASLVKATDIRLGYQERSKPITPAQKAAWENLVKEFGEGASRLEWPSAREAAEEGVKAMMEEAEKLLKNPAVKKAYDHFIMVCELTKKDNGSDN